MYRIVTIHTKVLCYLNLKPLGHILYVQHKLRAYMILLSSSVSLLTIQIIYLIHLCLVGFCTSNRIRTDTTLYVTQVAYPVCISRQIKSNQPEAFMWSQHPLLSLVDPLLYPFRFHYQFDSKNR